jgi:hypothetical protein
MYFYCFLVGAWMFSFGWFLGAIYTQHDDDKRESQRRDETPKLRFESEAWQLTARAQTSVNCEVTESDDQRRPEPHIF